MAKVKRRVVHDGNIYEVACAVRADGVTSPVDQFLNQLEGRAWRQETGETSTLNADEQYSAYEWVLAAIEFFAEHGEFHHRGNYNYLYEGIWEIKRYDLRISFYDTDGHGGYEPKMGVRSVYGGGGGFPLPDFDEYIRLGTVFEKTAARAPREELDLAAVIREEDLAHDRD